MKNPHLTLKLNLMMQEEQQERRQLISCLLSYYKKKHPELDLFEHIIKFMELSTDELSQLLGEIIDNPINKIMLGLNLN